ncbi:hypothetical protein PoB_003143300 [Plakobranchus ocellatus]|uniref:Uncharacterized protein n=1 Tax=Plakobranchus ocellatus TaxID=259542 RepID=A0AAV4ACD6_9GAST|nr:hypothetical protein PoB_003143300 [Plakobranchus ocellatus]
MSAADCFHKLSPSPLRRLVTTKGNHRKETMTQFCPVAVPDISDALLTPVSIFLVPQVQLACEAGGTLTVLLCFARVSKAAGDELCEQPHKFLRLATCFRVVSGLSSSRDLYDHVKYAYIALDETPYDLPKPETVTALSDFYRELIKYRTELDKLYESLTASYGDLIKGDASQTFADAVWTLQDKIGYVYGDVNNIIITLDMLKDSEIHSADPSKTTATKITAAAANAFSSKVEVKHLGIIRSEAKYVSGNLKELLTLWRHRCDACGYF